MSSFRAYSSKTKKYEWYILTSKREGFTSNKCKKEREMYTLVVYVYRIVNIVYTPYSSFSSKWVFILGLLAEMRVRRSCILSIRLYCDCQAQRLQWDASFDLLIVRSFFPWCYHSLSRTHKESTWIDTMKKRTKVWQDKYVYVC
jgi:hypothetical protein